MTREFLDTLTHNFARRNIHYDTGLSSAEIKRVEEAFHFIFPTDLKEFLQTLLPKGDKFPDWRDLESKELKSMLEWPSESICLDVEQNNFWLDAWGKKPENLADALEVARTAISNAPKLIPIYGHRYLPSPPTDAGNPVLSVYQTDIIY
ncbi:MAG: SMI1/KNR4 family protein [Trueperaceae bacterium]